MSAESGGRNTKCVHPTTHEGEMGTETAVMVIKERRSPDHFGFVVNSARPALVPPHNAVD
jgi:hypothetical protein